MSLIPPFQYSRDLWTWRIWVLARASAAAAECAYYLYILYIQALHVNPLNSTSQFIILLDKTRTRKDSYKFSFSYK